MGREGVKRINLPRTGLPYASPRAVGPRWSLLFLPISPSPHVALEDGQERSQPQALARGAAAAASRDPTNTSASLQLMSQHPLLPACAHLPSMSRLLHFLPPPCKRGSSAPRSRGARSRLAPFQRPACTAVGAPGQGRPPQPARLAALAALSLGSASRQAAAEGLGQAGRSRWGSEERGGTVSTATQTGDFQLASK